PGRSRRRARRRARALPAADRRGRPRGPRTGWTSSPPGWTRPHVRGRRERSTRDRRAERRLVSSARAGGHDPRVERREAREVVHALALELRHELLVLVEASLALVEPAWLEQLGV